jgi:hypothetical protein
MTTPSHEPVLTLHPDQADDLAHLLHQVEDWLRHAGDDARADLATFLNAPGNGALAAAGLIEALGCHAALLHQRLGEEAR